MTNEIVKVNEQTLMDVFGEYACDNSVMETVDYIKLPSISLDHRKIKYVFGENDAVESFEGYIIGKVIGRAHWPKAIEEQSTDEDKKPDCISVDGKSGSKHSTNCEKCPLNSFNIKDASLRKTSCKASLNLFVFIPERGDLPHHLRAAATSIKSWQPFISAIVREFKRGEKMPPLCGIKVNFSLKEESNKNLKTPYAVLSLVPNGIMTNRETFNKVQSMKDAFQSTMFRKIGEAATSAAAENASYEDAPNPF